MSQLNLRNAIYRLWQSLSKRRRRQFLLLALLLLFSTLSEILSLGAVLPFLGVLVEPEKVFSIPFIQSFAGYLGLTKAEQLIFPLTTIFVSAALLAGIFRLLVMWVNTRISYAAGHDLSVHIYKNTLYQPYHIHITRNSSEVISGINKVGHATSMLAQLIEMINAIIVSLAILTTLMVINPLVSGLTFLGFGLCYVSVVWITRRRLAKSSKTISVEATRRVKVLQEGLGGMREVLLNGNQPFFIDVYRRSDWFQRNAEGWNFFLQACPKYAIEALGMALIALLAYGLSQQNGGLGDALPMLGALALGAQRLLPALQQTYASWVRIHANLASVNDILILVEQPLPEGVLLPPPASLSFNNKVQFENVFFRYAEDGPWVINNLNLTIPKGARVGLVGSTGSGKSTTLDLLMGLLLPTNGRVLVDGTPISGERLRAWQRLIAHVPQNLFLTDNTLAENIGFGENFETIDMDLVKEAAQQAHITEFIESSPDGYNALVGERGVRVSGGQRQRLVIARALYRQASVLVFDEATSALDNSTERSVMDAIEELGMDLTILIIAHRLTTVKHCDFIVELDQGRVVAQGTYDQLLATSNSFQGMV